MTLFLEIIGAWLLAMGIAGFCMLLWKIAGLIKKK